MYFCPFLALCRGLDPRSFSACALGCATHSKLINGIRRDELSNPTTILIDTLAPMSIHLEAFAAVSQ